MNVLEIQKGVSKSLEDESRQSKWFKKRGMDIRIYQDRTIRNTQINIGEKVLWAISPNGGKTEMSICFLDLYLQDNPTHKVLVLTHNTKVLRNNFYQRIVDNKPSFTHQEVSKDNEVDFNKQVIVSLPATLSRRKLPKFDLVVIDEAHQMYESDNMSNDKSMVKKIIERCNIKKELLLTGTPSYFIRQNHKAPFIRRFGRSSGKYNIVSVPMSEVYESGACSDVIVEMSTSSYFVTDKDYNRDELKNDFNFVDKDTHHTLDDVNQKIYDRIVSPLRKPKHFSNKEIFKPITKPLDWSIFNKQLGKTLISCKNQSQAKQTAKYYKTKGVNVALSISDVDIEGVEIDNFLNNESCRILIVVNRGILGFSFNKIINVIDMSLTKNIDRMYQLFCRATRKNEDSVEKLFIKVIPSDREPHFRLRLTGMLCLMHDEWFTKFNGKNFLELDIPSTNRNTRSNRSGVSRGSVTPKREPFPMLGLPSMSILKDLYSNKGNLYSPVCWSQVGTIMRDLNRYVGKRGMITMEVIEDHYLSFRGKTYAELIEQSHIVEKARTLGVHGELMEKYQITQKHNRGEKDYSVLLTCKNSKDAHDSYNPEMVALYKTKNQELIKKYTGHFEPLRILKYSHEDAINFIEELDEFPKRIHGEDGLYRFVFHRNKKKYYPLIIKKFNLDKVPFGFLNDGDKKIIVERVLKSCKTYEDYYKNYINNYKKPLITRLGLKPLLDSLPKKRIRLSREDRLELIINNLKKCGNIKIQDFRLKHHKDYTWLHRNLSKDELRQLFEKYLIRERGI